MLVHDAGGYRLNVPPDGADSLRFARLSEEAADLVVAGQPERALRRIEEGRTAWRGRPFSPCSDEEWAVPVVSRLEELRRQLDETHVDALLAAGDPDRALAELEPVLATQPLRERPWEQQMLAAARAGRTHDALSAYRRAARLLRDELGVDPGPELRRLQSLVLAGEIDRPARPTANPGPAPEVHLPRRRGQLIGRRRELDELATALARTSPVTVVGGAGHGKTSLAVEFAREAAAEFVDGTFFVDLTAAQDARQLADAVTSALGLAGQIGTGGPLDALRVFTRDRRMLLLLDNCEQVLDPVAELVDALHVPGSELAVIVTSRVPLEVTGERLLELGPLPVVAAPGADPVSPAVQLFLTRLGEVTNDRAVDARARELAATICADVDGVPLAIELAAARGRAFELEEIAAQVRSDPSALSRIGRGRRGHLTVRAAVDRSFRLLGAEEQALHAALSVVPGPVTASLAAALVNRPPAEVGDLLAGLVHRSLLVAEGPQRAAGPSRFNQLATVRGHAAHALGADTDRVTALRDEAVLALIAARPRTGYVGEAAFHDAVDDDLPALRAALEQNLFRRPSAVGPALVAGLPMYCYYRGMILEGARWVRSAVAHLDRARPVDAALVHAGSAAVELLSRRSDLARPHVLALQAAFREMSGTDLLWVGDEFAGLCGPAFLIGDTDLLGFLSGCAERVAAATGDPNSALLARVADLKARPRAGAELLDRAVEVRAQALGIGNLWAAAMAVMDAVRASITDGQLQAALRWAEIATADYLALGARDAPHLTELRGVLHARLGEDEDAVRLFAGAKVQQQRAGMQWPVRPESPELLARAAGRLDRERYERAWRAGNGLRLADLAAAPSSSSA